MEHPTFTAAKPVSKRFHVHPTPAHIRDAVATALHEAAAEWTARTGMMFPTAHAIRAMNIGVNRACREHEEGL